MVDLTENKKGDINQCKELTQAQVDFLETCQEIEWGKLEVLVQDGEPSFSRLLEKTYQHKKKNH